MIRKIFLFSLVILIICSLLLLDNLESTAESITDKDALDIQNSPTHLTVSKGENYTNLSSRINTRFQNNNFPVIEPYDPLIIGDGFNKGKFAGYWVGRQIRNYVCNRFSLECNIRSPIENE